MQWNECHIAAGRLGGQGRNEGDTKAGGHQPELGRPLTDYEVDPRL